MDLREFLGILRARLRFGLLLLLVGLVVTVAVVLSTPSTYASSVKIFVSTPSGGLNEQVVSLFIGQRVASYADLARDPLVVEGVIEDLSLNTSVSALEEQIEASVVEDTQTIRIDTTADTPELARDIAGAEANQLVDLIQRLDRRGEGGPVISARVVGEPQYNEEPVSPNVPLNLAVGALLSVLLAVLGVLLRDLLDRTVSTRKEIEEITGRSVITTLPHVPRLREDPVGGDRSGELSEAFRVLRTNLQFATLDSEHQALLVSSPVHGNGKTLVATNLAVALAQSGRSVLLVDADLRAPKAAARLGLDNGAGVMTVLLGEAELEEVIQQHESGVSLLASGPLPPNPAEILGSHSMQELIAVVRQEFDAVIIDGPPLLPVADASILATEVDGVLMLSRHGSTTKEQLRLAAGRLETVGGRLVGTVLNGTPRSGDREGYGYGYGYGYASEAPQKERLRLRSRVPGFR